MKTSKPTTNRNDRHFRIAFNGRKIGALGLTSDYIESVWSDTYQNAAIKLYEKFEHIRVDYILDIKTQERVFPEPKKMKP